MCGFSAAALGPAYLGRRSLSKNDASARRRLRTSASSRFREANGYWPPPPLGH